MARPLRIAYEGAFYHVTARGNERKKIFLSPRDYQKFLSYLKDALVKYGVRVHCYVLMGNHVHLIVETPNANISAFMQNLNGSYTTYFNIKRKRAGHLFQGRYKAILIDADSYLLELTRYIHLNPVRAKIVEKAGEYPYSSYHAYVSPDEETFLYRDLLWGMISDDRKNAPQRYREFVESVEDSESPLRNVYAGMILGGVPFIKSVLAHAEDQAVTKEDISHRKALTSPVSGVDEIIGTISSFFGVSEEEVRNSPPYRSYAVFLTRKLTPLSNNEIGTYFGGISYSAVTKIGTRLAQRMRVDEELQARIRKLEEELSRVKG